MQCLVDENPKQPSHPLILLSVSSQLDLLKLVTIDARSKRTSLCPWISWTGRNSSCPSMCNTFAESPWLLADRDEALFADSVHRNRYTVYGLKNKTYTNCYRRESNELPRLPDYYTAPLLEEKKYPRSKCKTNLWAYHPSRLSLDWSPPAPTCFFAGTNPSSVAHNST